MINSSLIQKRKSSKLSSGEKIVSLYLRKGRINFIREHSFSDLVNDKTGNPLFFDFWLPRLNSVIEVDGRQHYEVVNGNEEEFAQQIYRDRLKNKYCSEKGIKILRLRYHQLQPPFYDLSNFLGKQIDVNRHIHKLAKKTKKTAEFEKNKKFKQKTKKHKKQTLRLTDRQKRNMKRAKMGERVKKANELRMQQIEEKRNQARAFYPPDLLEKVLKKHEKAIN